MPISENFTSILSKEFEINFLQCGPNGYLKHTELCNILQLTAAEHSKLGGISFLDMQQYNLAWVLSRMRVEIERLPRWTDVITVKTWICSLENSRSIRAFEVFLNGQKIIGSETFWAVLNTKTRRPENLCLPHEHFEKYPESRGTEKLLSKIKTPDNMQKIADKTIFLSDLDIVNHANNVKYLEWCLDYYDNTLIFSNQISSFDMNFVAELYLHDKVEIKRIANYEAYYFEIFKSNKISFALKVQNK